MASASLHPGLIVSNLGRHFLVEKSDGQRIICHSRGKKSLGVVGDCVLWQASGDAGTIEKIQTRRNLFYRQDELRTKSFAANLDQILILIAAEPAFSSKQLSRALIAAEAVQIKPLIVLNKSDLAESFARAWDWLEPYRRMGYPVLRMALKTASTADQATLLSLMSGKTTLLLGPSGAGKSTLINWLKPGALAQTAEISRALNSGKHIECDTVVFSGDWIPENELARKTNLNICAGSRAPEVDSFGRTRQPGVFAIGNAVHPAEASDLCALNAHRAVDAIRSWLNDGEWSNSAVAVRVQSPLLHTWPSLVTRDDANARMLLRVSKFVEPHSRITVLQAGKTIYSTNHRRTIVTNRSFTLPMRWANQVDPTLGDVEIAVTSSV